ncbi:baseplate tail tube cap [Agrobacterium phage OLIVR5]|uniref:Baseplate tail tube cap n=3 Tax=Caudoviricetes TaxID=2731619 RepID=A0A858MZ92_9CAUD|nr:baseplate tail tube cap [Agrobacterium phage OLIVR5]QIW87875.1 baseplate tail tube cap [Agrobacterium phage OLIVR5]QIW88140.1 baseplate tail tube cap [Agrobacterium phage OLIVR6]
MAKTASEIAGTKALSFDFSIPDKNGMSIPKIQIRAYRITSNLMTGMDNGTIDITSPTSIINSAKRSREHSCTATLPIPDNLRFSTDFNWNAEEKNLLATFVGSLNAPESSRQEIQSPNAIGIAVARAIESVDMFGGDMIIRNMGLYSDALRELFFRGQEYRKFTWNWELVPRNAIEAEQMMLCVRKLNLDSHPEKLSHGINILPGEFEVSWVDAKLPAIGKLVCTNFEADYGDGSPVPRFTRDKYPSAIKFTMSFMELERQDRKQLERSQY